MMRRLATRSTPANWRARRWMFSPREPLAPDSPIWDLPNTIITPHTGGASSGYSERGAAIFKRNLDALLSGGEMINVYDRERGY